MNDADALAGACAGAMFGRDRAAQSLDILVIEARPGFARLVLTIAETMVNGLAIAHGGIVFTLADTAFAYACNSRNVPHVALNASISFMTAAHLGDRLEAVAQERSLRGRTGVYDVTVSQHPAGELVAVFRGTAYRVNGTVLD